MLLKFCDITNTFCQAFIFASLTQGIVPKEKRLSRLKLFILIIAISAEVIFLTYSNINIPFSNFIMMMVVLLLVLIFFKDSIKEAFIGYGMSYFIVAIAAYFLVTIYQNFLLPLNLPISQEIQMPLFIFVPVWILYYFLYRFRKYIFDIALFFKNLRNSLFFVILIDFSLVILDTLRIEWTNEEMTVSFKFFIYLLAFMVFISAIVFFAKINSKSKEVEILNRQLNEKIIELKKLKHDYGSEISTLYGLYQLNKYDKIGEILKEIVDRYQRMSTPINVEHMVNPIVSSVLYRASNAGVNVITIDDADYDGLRLSDNDLLKVLSNIVNNAVDALKNIEHPTIKFKSYNNYQGVVISIINNGPKIPDNIKDKMFQSGFTTKSKLDGERGFGLSIVKDIINKCGGKISVYSDEEFTHFKLEVPKMKIY